MSNGINDLATLQIRPGYYRIEGVHVDSTGKRRLTNPGITLGVISFGDDAVKLVIGDDDFSTHKSFNAAVAAAKNALLNQS